MVRFKDVDGVPTQLTSAEETARDAEEAVWAAGATDRQVEGNQRHRNAKLAETDFIPTRQRDQSDRGGPPEMSTPVYHDWLDYRQDLRDITTQPDPFNISWPTDPDGGSSAP